MDEGPLFAVDRSKAAGPLSAHSIIIPDRYWHIPAVSGGGRESSGRNLGTARFLRFTLIRRHATRHTIVTSMQP
jgi:hypothetical protein